MISRLFKKHWSIKFLFIWTLIALLAPILANDKALIISGDDGIEFPFINQSIDNSEESNFKLMALIPYSSNSIDFKNANAVGPFESQIIDSWRYRHWLGTDLLGRDVLANLIYGSRTALLIGLGAMFIALLLGVFLGSIAGYFGDYGFNLMRGQLIVLVGLILIFLLAFFVIIPWNISVVGTGFKLIQFLIITSILIGAYILINKLLIRKKGKLLNIPLDLIIGRVIEIMEAIPVLFLLIALSAILRPSIGSVVLIIGLGAWPGIAKFTRAEVLKIRNMDYIDNSKALGLSNSQILLNHILPNSISPVLISLAFGLAASVLLESTLSFLGLGITTDTASWGQLLSSARQNYEAWWLALFPGLAIFLSVMAANSLGEKVLSNKN